MIVDSQARSDWKHRDLTDFATTSNLLDWIDETTDMTKRLGFR